MMRYVLDEDGNPRHEPDLHAWAQWIETADRHVAHYAHDDFEVSTVFLGLDHNFSGEGDPVLWETMIFEGPLDLSMWRYRSREDAVVGHRTFVSDGHRQRCFAHARTGADNDIFLPL